jgi:hypothetical protein
MAKVTTGIKVDYFPADFDNSGAYDYLVATYDGNGVGVKIRILRNINGKVQLAGVLDPSDSIEFVGFPTTVNLVYIDNSGVPALEIHNLGVDGRHFGFNLLRWTGTRLVSMLPVGASMVDSYFADPLGSGIPEIINPPDCDLGECEGDFEVYQLRRGRYVRTATSNSDPSGLIPAPGEHSPLPDIVMAQPNQFAVADILAAFTKNEIGGEVVFRFGNLLPVDSTSSSTDVSGVDLGSIYAGRNLKPSRVQIVPATRGKAMGFNGAFIEISLARIGVLQYLAKVEPSGPPVPGEVIPLPIHARLKNGVALYGFAPITLNP